MGTKMGAAGVRIELTDNSAYGMVENPSTIAGVVGFASKGELNKIITLANTAEQDTKLGYGFQSYKYNQGMYAARAVLNAGGHVEFVRPYGETIDKSDPYKRDLKTDAYVIAYDKNAAKYDSKLYKQNSLNLKHFASTRFKTDGAAEYGVTRKINNISETITEGSNINFNIDASENFADSAACRWYDSTKKLAPTDMVLGAIMNTDPSNSYRAYDRYEVVTSSYKSTTTGTNPIIECVLATYPGFIVGDTVRLPISSGGTSSRTAKALVTDINDKNVVLEIQDKDFNITGINKPNAIIFCDKDNAMADGYDYMSVKTAVAGRSVKTFTTLHWGDKDNIYSPKSSIANGTMLAFYDRFHSPYYLRFANNSCEVYTTTASAPAVSADTGNWTLKLTSTDSILVGDELTIYPANNVDTKAIVTVLSVDGKTIVTTPDSDIAIASMVSGMSVKVSGFSEDYVAFTVDISGATCWEDVSAAIVDTLYSSDIGYGNGVIANDIGKDSDGDGVIDQWFDKSGDVRNIVWVEPSASYDYSIGDLVAIVRGKTVAKYGTKEAATADMTMSEIEKKNVLYVAKIIDINTLNGKITLESGVNVPDIYDPAAGLTAKNSVQFNGTKVPLTFQLVDLTNSAFVAYNAVVSQSYVQKISDSNTYNQYSFSNGQFTKIQSSNFAPKVSIGDTLNFNYKYYDEDGTTQLEQKNVGFTVTAIDSSTNWLTGTTVKNLPTPVPGSALTGMVAEVTHTRDEVDTYIISNYSLYVSSQMQDTTQVSEVDEIAGLTITKGDTTHVTAIIDKSPKVLADADIGATFLNLGLATTGYIDMNYDGNPVQVYVLNADGENIARMFMSVSYMYNGKLYEFEGTIVPYSYNDTQLFIGDAADSELTNSGATFVLNESGVLEYFLENISYDLSQTIVNGTLTGISTCISYNDDDPAIQNDAVWAYNPLNNRSGSTLSTAWNLFLDKDGSDVSMLVAAGCGINNLFMKNLEGLNTQVMQAMLNVCELRKDCFAICDGVGEAKLATALKKNILATGFGSTLGRWGAIYDGRGIFFDSLYTKGNVEVVKSVQLASLITTNRSGGIWWNVPSGKTNGIVPSAWGTREKYPRRFSYPEDTESDVAKLSDIHCNPTRSTADGLYIWGDFTMQMEDTAFNQIHVAMLMAGVHKSFYKYLDDKVFRLNTTNLRAQITSDLQAKLNSIITANPAGFYEATVICDDSNNPPEVIDQNKLFVDLKVKPTKSTRYIYLRSEVLATSDGNQISTTLS